MYRTVSCVGFPVLSRAVLLLSLCLVCVTVGHYVRTVVPPNAATNKIHKKFHFRLFDVVGCDGFREDDYRLAEY